MTEEPSVEKAIDMIMDEGKIDGMAADAGMTKHQPALQFTREEAEKPFNLNVRPSHPFSLGPKTYSNIDIFSQVFRAFSCAQIAAHKFIALGIKGSIVFAASMTSYRPNCAAPFALYGGTKTAMRNMTHTLAMEWAKHGIRVNSISPGFVKTAMTCYVKKAPD